MDFALTRKSLFSILVLIPFVFIPMILIFDESGECFGCWLLFAIVSFFVGVLLGLLPLPAKSVFRLGVIGSFSMVLLLSINDLDVHLDAWTVYEELMQAVAFGIALCFAFVLAYGAGVILRLALRRAASTAYEYVVMQMPLGKALLLIVCLFLSTWIVYAIGFRGNGGDFFVNGPLISAYVLAVLGMYRLSYQ